MKSSPKTLRIVHIGDLHFDKLLRHFGEQALPLMITEIRKPLDYALDKGIKHVIFLGDIADKPRLTEESLIAFILLLKEYADKGLTLHVIKGNHDVENKDRHALRGLEDLVLAGMLPGVHIYTDPKLVDIDGVPVYFAPFPCTFGLRDALNIGHFDTPGVIRDNGVVAPGEQPPFTGHWVLGHLHTPQEANGRHYAGTSYQLSRAEQRIKSFTVTTLTYDRKAKPGSRLGVRHLRIPLTPAFQFIGIEVVKLKDLERVNDNPLHLHTLWIKSKVELPATFLADHPNVVEVIPYSNRKDLKKLQTTGIERAELELDAIFESFIVDRFKLTPQELRFARLKVKQYHGQLSSGSLPSVQ